MTENEGMEKSAAITIEEHQAWNEECGCGITLYCSRLCLCVPVLNALINMVDVTNLPSSDRMWIQSPGAITARSLPSSVSLSFFASVLFFSAEK